MYRLEIFHPNTERPTLTVTVDRASQLLSTIATFRDLQPGCAYIDVRYGPTFLFRA
jgi:hypothetical protein